MRLSGLLIAAATAFLVLLPPPGPGPVVRVASEIGFGSGVVLRDGYVLTAAHVVEGAMSIITDMDETIPAEIVWSDEAHDVALLKTDWRGQTMPVACRAPRVGESVAMHGNPPLFGAVTTWGRVAGEPRNLRRWVRVSPVDGTAVEGMSGGPVTHGGVVIGISVGHAAFPARIPGTPFVYRYGMPLSFMVPGDALCALLAR